jgi:hypothetical protein
MTRLENNLTKGLAAILYLTGLNILSENHEDRHARQVLGLADDDEAALPDMTDLDTFLFWAARADHPSLPGPVLMRRWQIAQILNTPRLTPSAKRGLLEQFCRQWHWYYFVPYAKLTGPVPGTPDEKRIRAVRRAVQFGYGNCGEKSAIVATWLLENSDGAENILWCSSEVPNHQFVVFGHEGASWDGVLRSLSSDAVIVDGWSADCYPPRALEGFQARAEEDRAAPEKIRDWGRDHVWKGDGGVEVLEYVHRSRPTRFIRNFRLPTGKAALRRNPLLELAGGLDHLFGVVSRPEALVRLVEEDDVPTATPCR